MFTIILTLGAMSDRTRNVLRNILMHDRGLSPEAVKPLLRERTIVIGEYVQPQNAQRHMDQLLAAFKNGEVQVTCDGLERAMNLYNSVQDYARRERAQLRIEHEDWLAETADARAEEYWQFEARVRAEIRASRPTPRPEEWGLEPEVRVAPVAAAPMPAPAPAVTKQNRGRRTNAARIERILKVGREWMDIPRVDLGPVVRFGL